MFVNTDALLTSNKALSIIFIILICLVNIPLIYRQVRKPLFYQNAKWMIIISLAIGDVILALFPLVVMARQYFNPYWAIPCRLGMTYITYIGYLINFVYGFGVIALAIEVLMRQKFQGSVNKAMTALGLSAFPWILGLIIILPLCLANVDYFRCQFIQPPGTLFGVSVLFPACLAFVVTLLLNCMNLSTSSPQQSTAYIQQNVAFSQESVSLPVPNQIHPNPQIHRNYNGTSYPQDINQQYPPNPQYPQYPQYPPNPQPSYNTMYAHQPHPQYPYTQPGIVQQYAPSQSNAPVVYQATNQGTSYATNSNFNRRKEAQLLVAVAVVFCVMKIPYAAYFLTLSNGGIIYGDTLTLTIVTQCLSWLSIARSCVTPLFMFNYSRL